uniref:Secretory carrier membrane protein n=1 Tax=Timspurckia oligopyrenoides TaxID=708627 RepID=A0A7S1EUV6_9RHOD|mmetsp:Transcript_9418/g.16987  ORF Transcript_9418/g.16987 Transcript_9418/m.16987 type:complete len:257 (+) Transcript_9418:68-838(+)
MDWIGQKALESQFEGIGRDLGLSSDQPNQARSSKWSVFGNSSTNPDSTPNESAIQIDHEPNNFPFPPVFKFFYVDLSILTNESILSCLYKSRLLLAFQLTALILNVISNLIILCLGVHNGWIWFLLSILFCAGFSHAAVWNYAMAFRGVRFNPVSHNVMRNSMYFYSGMLIVGLFYSLAGILNWNGWTRFVTAKIFYYKLTTVVESTFWMMIIGYQIFVMVEYYRLEDKVNEANEVRVNSLEEVRNRYANGSNNRV